MPGPTLDWISFDCNDPYTVARFWSSLLGNASIETGDDWATIKEARAGGPSMAFMKVPEGKTAKNRVHLDLAVDDVHSETERALSLGARKPDGVLAGPFDHQVLLDPEGNEFCLCPRGG